MEALLLLLLVVVEVVVLALLVMMVLSALDFEVCLLQSLYFGCFVDLLPPW